MKRSLFLLLTLCAFAASAQVPAVTEIVKTNSTGQRIAAMGEAMEVYTASGTDTYTVNISVLGLYSGAATYAAGDQFTIDFTNPNTTTTPTININSEGAITITRANGDPLAAGDLDGITKLAHDGTNFRIVGGTGGGSTGKVFPFAVTDEVIPITTGTSVLSFRIPYAMTLTGIRANIVTAQASGSILTIDINEGGTTILSTKLTIDNTETTSVSATTPVVISDTSLADDAIITIDIDQVDAATAAAGLKITLYGN